MVKLTENMYYEKIQYQYVLYKARKVVDKETGEEKTGKTLVGYYTTLEGVLIGAARELVGDKVASGEITTIQQHISEIKETVKKLTEGL